jgi:hypothetical protein
MRRTWALVLALSLAACAAVREEGGLVEPVMEPEVVLEAPAPCVAGDDDGIGGTGCPVE